MQPNDTKISRHNNPDLVKVEFVGDEDTVVVSMIGQGVSDLSDEQSVGRARRVMAGLVDGQGQSDGVASRVGTDQTLSQP